MAAWKRRKRRNFDSSNNAFGSKYFFLLLVLLLLLLLLLLRSVKCFPHHEWVLVGAGLVAINDPEVEVAVVGPSALLVDGLGFNGELVVFFGAPLLLPPQFLLNFLGLLLLLGFGLGSIFLTAISCHLKLNN